MTRLAFAFGAGLLSPLNPCGFALLPAFLGYYIGSDEPSPRPLVGRVSQGLAIGGVLSAGFGGVFAFGGLLVSLGLRSIINVAPVAAVVIGVVLAGLGVAMLAGRRIGLDIQRQLRPGEGRGYRNIFLFGAGYALASLACTIAVLLAVIAVALDTRNPAELLGVLLAYGTGAATLLTALTVATGIAKQSLLTRTRRLMPFVERAAAVLLVLSGVYLVLTNLPGVKDTALARDAYARLSGLSSRLTNLLDGHWQVFLPVAGVLAALAALSVWRRRRSAARPGGMVDDAGRAVDATQERAAADIEEGPCDVCAPSTANTSRRAADRPGMDLIQEEEAMQRMQMPVFGMTCDSCNTHVERALVSAGARQASADWRRGEAVFAVEEGVSKVRLAHAVRDAGYGSGPIEVLASSEPKSQPAPGVSDGDYDLVAIGSGSAAFAAAIRATNLGARVALIERNTVGGTCVNVGCIPSKNLLAASETYHHAGHHPFQGVFTSQDGTDFAAVIDKKAEVVSMLRREKYLDLAEHYGFDIIQGSARFTGPDTIDVNGREIRAASFLISTGSAPWVPPIEGLQDAGYLTSTTAMELKELPESMVVIGGNYIGLEMGQVFANLGTKVTIVEALNRIAPLEEPEISEWMHRVLTEQGIEIATSAKVTRVEAGERKAVVAEVNGEERRFEAAEVLVATGRRPVVDGLDLERAGVERDERGGLVLDDELRTTNPRVFAAGDVTGAPQFVYVAAAQGTLAADNAISGAGRKMDYRALPRVTFTTPNIAAVGLTDQQAQDAGYECECRVLELENVPRPIVNLDTRGAFKIVAEAGSGKVLGVHAIAANAGDVILAGVYAIKFGLTVQDLADTWAPYLTMAEGIKLTAQTFTTDVDKLSCCAA